MPVRRLLCLAVVLAATVALGHSEALAQGTPLFAVLLGGNEVTTTDPNVGDQNAFGSASVILRPNQDPNLCFSILVTGVDGAPSGAHIHQARAGRNGPIVVNLALPADGNGDPAGNPGTSAGCTNITADLLSAIRANPSNYYVNIHSLPSFAGGALRGQLF